MTKSNQGIEGKLDFPSIFFICKYTHKSNKNENNFHFSKKNISNLLY